MAVGDTHVFPGFLTPVLTQISFQSPSTTFFTCFSRGERRKYAGKTFRLNRVLNSQPPGHESDMFTTKRGLCTDAWIDRLIQVYPRKHLFCRGIIRSQSWLIYLCVCLVSLPQQWGFSKPCLSHYQTTKF